MTVTIQAYVTDMETYRDRKIGKPFTMQDTSNLAIEEKEEELDNSYRNKGSLKENEVVILKEI